MHYRVRLRERVCERTSKPNTQFLSHTHKERVKILLWFFCETKVRSKDGITSSDYKKKKDKKSKSSLIKFHARKNNGISLSKFVEYLFKPSGETARLYINYLRRLTPPLSTQAWKAKPVVIDHQVTAHTPRNDKWKNTKKGRIKKS